MHNMENYDDVVFVGTVMTPALRGDCLRGPGGTNLPWLGEALPPCSMPWCPAWVFAIIGLESRIKCWIGQAVPPLKAPL